MWSLGKRGANSETEPGLNSLRGGPMGSFRHYVHRVRYILLAILIIAWQTLFAAWPFIQTATTKAAPIKITAKTHQGQESVGTYTSGNITTYSEGDPINFRFNVESTGASSGQLEVRFTGNDGTCLFFDGSFNLGTHDNSADAIVPVSGVTPTVSTSGSPVAQNFGTSNGEWVQTLNISFTGTGEATVNYWLTLSNEAGECNGSSQHSRLNPAGGDVTQSGQQNVPVPANQIIELPEIYVQKWVDSNGDGTVDRRATAGEWKFSLDGGTPVATDGNGEVVFTNVTPNGNHTVTESNGPAGQSFISGSGTNCTFNGSTATANVQSGTTAQDATCIFNNGVSPGSIKIVKDAQPNDAQNFHFTTTGTGLSAFDLDDDSDATLPNSKTFTGLTTGTYSVTEEAVTGWDFKDIVCTGGSSIQKSGATVTIDLAAGENVICTYTNVKRGHLIVQKTTNPAGDSTVFSINASGTGTVTGGGAGTVTDATDHDYEVTPGTYSVSETVPSGWSKTGDTCQNVAVAAGATVYCTLTNTKLATIVIVKDALPNHSQNFSFLTSTLPGGNFLLDDDSGAAGEDATYNNQKTFSDLTPNTAYSVTEESAAGWQLTDLTCDKGTYNILGSQVTITPDPGQTITCTYTNTKLGTISGTKNEVNADGSLVDTLSGWDIILWLDGQQVSQTTTDGSGNYSFGDLLPGNYTLTEILKSGYTQIYDADPVSLSAGDVSTGNDFGNFENGSVSGYKWNDLNGDGEKTENEPKLSGWTIRLLRSDDNTVDGDYVEIATTTTDINGNYSFTNLSPLPSRFYAVCEVQQTNWVQTSPLNNACRYFELNLSGESNNNRNFGNQGRGTIQVIKNVDTDGDGKVDTSGATDWTWDINGSGNYATGSTQNVAAGTYTVSEDQKDGYHVTASSCTGETTPGTATTSLSATVTPGENVVCTFTNTRNTGTITVNKVVNPANDSGKFDLRINGTVYADDVGNGGTTGAVQLPTGNYTVSEVAGTGTSLADYSSSLSCSNGQTGTTFSDEFALSTDQNITCTFTNVRYGHIIVEKQTLPNGSSQSFDFTASYDNDGFTLTDGQQNNSGNLLPGNYSVAETAVDGWDSDGGVCSDQSSPSSVSLSAGETVTCVFTNTQRGSITGTKYEVNADATDGTDGTPLQYWTIFIDSNGNGELNLGETSTTTNVLGQYEFSNLKPDNYVVCEVVQEGWTQIFPSGQTNCHNVTLDPGENDSGNDFGNFHNGSISGYKFNDHNGNGIEDENDEHLEGWEITLYQGESVIDTTTTDSTGAYSFNDLAPGTYTVCETGQSGWTQTTSPECYTIEINVSGESDTAIFGNQGRGSVTVVKNIDTNGDGQGDILGATDWTWDINGNYYTDSNVVTGTTKDGIPADTYTIHEDQQVGYAFESVVCMKDREVNQEVSQAETTSVTLSPGDDITCTFTNRRLPIVLNLTKSNNKPNPTTVGDVVTYTLVVSLPENSGVSYNTQVVDLPPEGFVYIPGSATATQGSLTEQYGSPGTWTIGTMLPGDSVTLTYQATITSSVSPGTYPDLAFASGCAIPSEECGDTDLAYSNVHDGNEDPFVGTKVTIAAPQVLGATILVNTGTPFLAYSVLSGAILLGATGATIARRRDITKGGRK
jgi:uncharacterized repeat protein (TIGR01451 family)